MKESNPPFSEHTNRLCAQTELEVKGLQKLQHPLKILIEVTLCESGREKSAKIEYKFLDLPFLAQPTAP